LGENVVMAQHVHVFFAEHEDFETQPWGFTPVGLSQKMADRILNCHFNGTNDKYMINRKSWGSQC
jgi:hypothetical protein